MRRVAGAIIMLLALAAPAPVPPALAASCDNPYAPVGKALPKTYRFKSKGAAPSSQYTVTVEKMTATGFEMRYTDQTGTYTVPYTCTPDGLASGQFGLGRGPSGSVTYKVTSSSGVVIPRPDRWRVGNSWIATSQGTVSASASDQKYTFKSILTFKVVANERVTVPVGSFDAVKVTLTQKGEFGAGGYVQPLNYSGTLWFASGVGLVRQEDEFGVHELVSYKH